MDLDRIDRHILDLLQTNNQIANMALADKVGLSPPACSRRVARLRQQGIIEREVAILNPTKVGKGVSVFVTVVLENRQREQQERFTRKVVGRAEVYQCSLVSGAVDYVLLVVTDTIESYKTFANDVLSQDNNIKSYESWFVLSSLKNETKIPMT